MRVRLTLKRKYDKLGSFKTFDGVVTLFEKPEFLITNIRHPFKNGKILKDHKMSNIDKNLNNHNLMDVLSRDRFIDKYSYMTFQFYTDTVSPTLKDICEVIPNKIYEKSCKIYVDYDENMGLVGNSNYVPFIGKYCYSLHMICVDKRYKNF